MKIRTAPVCFALLLFALTQLVLQASNLHLNVRFQEKNAAGKFELIQEQRTLVAEKTAIVVCDMWDKHWCKGATSRVAEMAPRMNDVIKTLRRKGVLIIHAP